jgi:hypothetical protein
MNVLTQQQASRTHTRHIMFMLRLPTFKIWLNIEIYIHFPWHVWC